VQNAWNTTPFSQNSGMQSLGAAAGRLKPQPRGRSQLPAVSVTSYATCIVLTFRY
jgi:hypothetical protein